MTMHTVTVVRQYLAAVFSIVIGLTAAGCGDSATVNPVVELAGLTVTPGTLTPAFSGGTTQYTVDLTSDTTNVTVTAQPAVAGDSVAINGQATTSSAITLDPPGSTTIVNVVVSETNTNSRTYVIRLVRAGLTGNNSLQRLTVSSGDLAPSFDANIQDYTVDVLNSVGTVNVTPTLDDPNATMTVNGQAAISGQPRAVTLNPAGQSTLITTVVTAQNSSNKSYRITVSRGVSANNSLSGLTVSPGSLAPSFSSGTVGYTLNVGSGATSVTVTPRLQDTAASMTVNGQATNSGQARAITLNGAGSNTFINIVVTAQNGTQKTYSVNVIRAALGGNNNLSGLTVSPGALDSPFNANDLSYTMNVGSTMTSVAVTATLQDTNATMTVEGQGTSSGQRRSINLGAAGTSTIIDILVTAPNGSQKPYRVTVNKAALASNNNLQSLLVSPGALDPRFSANTFGYTVDVASGVNSVRVTPRSQDSGASMTVNGQAVASRQAAIVPLNGPGQSTPIPIVVTAPNGSQKTYTITAERAAPSSNNNLSALRVTPGSLAPAFAAATQTYAVGVASDVASITVTATLADTNATMTVEGQGTSSGQARSILLGDSPSSTAIEIIVIAPNGSSKTYTITANRAAPTAPPAPASAPDLIPEDDSGLLPGQDADNITNVNTPRFRVPSPGDGEIPGLYIDGDKVDATFDQGATTLKPTSALSDGDHTITCTVTNGGGESSQSPALTVTIDTVAPGGP